MLYISIVVPAPAPATVAVVVDVILGVTSTNMSISTTITYTYVTSKTSWLSPGVLYISSETDSSGVDTELRYFIQTI